MVDFQLPRRSTCSTALSTLSTFVSWGSRLRALPVSIAQRRVRAASSTAGQSVSEA